MTKQIRSRILTNTGRIIQPGLLEQYAIKKSDPGGSQQVAEDPFTTTYGQYNLVEPIYNPTQLITLTEVNTYHKRCCDQKALDVAGSGFTIQPTTEGKGSETNKKRLEDFFLNQSDPRTWRRAHNDFEQIGYATIELVRYNNNPQAEYKKAVHLPGHTIRIHKDKSKFLQTRGNNKVWFKNVEYKGEIDNHTGDPINVNVAAAPETLGTRANEVLYLKNDTPRDDFYGVPDYIPAIPTMYGDQSRAIFNVAFFDNYGIPTYAITITGDFDEGERDSETGLTALETSLKSQLQDIQSNPHSTMAITLPAKDGLQNESKVDVKFQPLSVDVKEASFRLYRLDNRDEVITAHGMDPYRIGVMVEGSMGGNTSIQSKKNYNYGTVQPRQQLWEDAINKYIVRDGFGITDYVFRFDPIDLEETEQDLLMATQLFNLASMTPNQLIAVFGDKFGLEPVKHPALDAHYLNGQPIDYIPETPETPEVVVETLKSLRDGILEAIEDEDKDSTEDSGFTGRLTNKIRETISS